MRSINDFRLTEISKYLFLFLSIRSFPIFLFLFLHLFFSLFLYLHIFLYVYLIVISIPFLLSTNICVYLFVNLSFLYTVGIILRLSFPRLPDVVYHIHPLYIEQLFSLYFFISFYLYPINVHVAKFTLFLFSFDRIKSFSMSSLYLYLYFPSNLFITFSLAASFRLL